MADYKQEQADEREALESIFPDEFEMVNEQLYLLQVRVDVPVVEGGVPDELRPTPEHPDDPIPEPPTESSVTLRIKVPEQYPDELPAFGLEDLVDVSQEEQDAILALIQEQAEENAGMPMVFAIHSAVLEWLEDRNDARHDTLVADIKAIADRKAEEEIAEMIKGTLVTKESFEEWRLGFVAELDAARAKKETAVKTSTKLKPVYTGKQLFMMNQKLKDSDATQVEEDEVAVDKSLFASLDAEDLPDVDALDG